MHISPIQYEAAFHDRTLFLGVTFKRTGARYTYKCRISSKNIGSCRAVLFSSLRDAIISTFSLDTLPPTGVKLSLYICAGSVYAKPYTHFQHVTHSIQFSLNMSLRIIDSRINTLNFILILSFVYSFVLNECHKLLEYRPENGNKTAKNQL